MPADMLLQENQLLQFKENIYWDGFIEEFTNIKRLYISLSKTKLLFAFLSFSFQDSQKSLQVFLERMFEPSPRSVSDISQLLF